MYAIRSYYALKKQSTSMRKLALLAFVTVIGLSALFTSCSKDENKGLEIIGTWEIVSETRNNFV